MPPWILNTLGIIVLVGDAVNLITVTIEKEGLPTNVTQWTYTIANLAMGIGLLMAKQFNVSNSPKPAAPTVVATAAMHTPNPAAVPAKP